jgi:hypothetical protein
VRKIMWLKGTTLGVVIFVASLFVVIRQRTLHGFSTGFSEMSTFWLVLVVYLVVCLVAGCLIYFIASRCWLRLRSLRATNVKEN